MKTSTQLKALIRNRSKKTTVEAEILLRNYMMERFLERISLSNYKNNFILKGGMLIGSIVGIETRTTMDMDVTIKGQTLNTQEITAIVHEILSVPVSDNVEFSLRDIEEIREEANYPGYRISIIAILEKTRQILKIDITTGDYVTPREIEYSFKLMFENRTIGIMAYNLETVLAEKFETIVTRGTTNTRMRDFYDIYIITNTQKFDERIFVNALGKTIEKRETYKQMSDSSYAITMVSENLMMIELWKKYNKKYQYATDITWDKVIGAVRVLASFAKYKDKPVR